MRKAAVPSQRESLVFRQRYSDSTLMCLCRVAATKTPIIFLGVGEHLHDLDRFAPEPFISKLLGMGDIQGFMDHMQNVALQNDPEKQKEIQKKIGEGKLSINDWKEQMANVMNM